MDPGKEQELKQYFFKEYTLLVNQREENKAVYEKFIKERKAFDEDMKQLNARILEERKRLNEDNLFFEKKMDILKNGFMELEMDRKKLEKEKSDFEHRRKLTGESEGEIIRIGALFTGSGGSSGLKKRYRDLQKIFHPDNCQGNEGIIKAINDEYDRLKDHS